MTKPPKRSTLNRTFDRAILSGAASREAARTGRTEVDFEHLLLGLLVNGGPGARLLMESGVGLAEARSAVDDLLREDLALLGVDAPVPPPADEDAKGWLPYTPRLGEVEYDSPLAGGDAVLLAALIDDEGGRVRRVLDRLGADTDQIRRDLDALVEDPSAAEDSRAPADRTEDAEVAPEGWEYAYYDLDVPVSAERIWDLVSDPERRSEWEPAQVRSRLLDDGVVEMTKQVEDWTGQTFRESITRSVPGREVTWTREEHGSRPERVLRILIEPAGQGSRLRLRSCRPVGLAAHRVLARRVIRWLVRRMMQGEAQAIAQAAAS